MVKVVRDNATLTSVGQAMEIQEVSFNTVSHGQRKAIENNEFLFYLLNIFLIKYPLSLLLCIHSVLIWLVLSSAHVYALIFFKTSPLTGKVNFPR